MKESLFSNFNSVNAVMDKLPKGNRIYIGGFSAKIGSDNMDYERVMGHDGLVEMSENGQLFPEFCDRPDDWGSHFPRRPVHKVAFVSRDEHTENQIDRIYISRKWRRSLIDVRNKRIADIAFDHHLLIDKIRLRIARIQRQEERLRRRFVIS